jgi:hypothetical protein
VSILSQKLLSELDRNGFCHDTLKSIQRACREALKKHPATLDPSDHVMLYVIEDVCVGVTEWLVGKLDVGSGADPHRHDQAEKTFSPQFRETVGKLGEPLPCEEKMASLSALLDTLREIQCSQ